MSRYINNHPALVVGLCSHGLATVRALAKCGVEVHAIEADVRLPGVKTKMARVHVADNIGDKLIEALIQVRKKIGSSEKPVLFLMNDKMVLEVANQWEEIKDYYCLSWSDNKKIVASLLQKSTLEKRCEAVGLNYPKSWLIAAPQDIHETGNLFEYPLIAKPSRPMGEFKAKKINNKSELFSLAKSYKYESPLLLQQWIPGEDTSLHFSNLYLSGGRPIASFTGRKVRSYPPALGQGIIVEPCQDDMVYNTTLKFFEGLNLSGPAALELKKHNNKLWVIEPTLGRTEFLVAVCIANKVNIPFIEYCDVVGIAPPNQEQQYDVRWFDTEKAPLCYMSFLFSNSESRLKRAVFPYWEVSDLGPFYQAAKNLALRIIERVKV